MYQTKAGIYLNFDKTQKSAVCNYIRALVKQNLELSSSELLEKFLQDERYYLELNASRFPFLLNIIDDTQFQQDTKTYIEACIKYYQYKQNQKPIIEANKEYEKKKRKFLQELKMSKETPTKKQLYYHERLCKKYAVEKINIEDLTKLDLRNEIERILNEHKDDNKYFN